MPVTMSIMTVWSGSSVTVLRMATIGSSTEPSLSDSGPAARIASGSAVLALRPMKRARSVSYDTVPGAASDPASDPASGPAPDTTPGAPPDTCGRTTIRWNIHGACSSRERGRRVHRMAWRARTISVCTNRLLNAGCRASVAGGAITTSA